MPKNRSRRLLPRASSRFEYTVKPSRRNSAVNAAAAYPRRAPPAHLMPQYFACSLTRSGNESSVSAQSTK